MTGLPHANAQQTFRRRGAGEPAPRLGTRLAVESGIACLLQPRVERDVALCGRRERGREDPADASCSPPR